MSNCQISFQYNKKDFVIMCHINELLLNKIIHYEEKSILPIEKFFFLCGSKKINSDLTLTKINHKSEDILVLACPNKNEENKNKMQKSYFIKCAEYIKKILVEFLNGYWIILPDKKYEAKKIKMQDYSNIQIFDQSKIKCLNCSKSMTEDQSKFYYCFDKNFLEIFKKNIDFYVQINKKLNENLLNGNVNYEILKTRKNLNETSILKENIYKIFNNKKINKKFKKIMSMYNIINNNEIKLKIQIEQNDINNIIYFLDNTESDFYENGNLITHKHDNLSELNESNTTLIIDGKTFPFKKYFIPSKKGIYTIKLIFKKKLSDSSYMFYNCKNIIDIDFSKFKTENIKNMQRMFDGCSGLKSLNLKSFKTENVTNMMHMFRNCTSLTSLNLQSFNTKKVTDMSGMFSNCFFLVLLDLSSFNTKNVITMRCMFYKCFSLTTINLFSFNTKNVIDMESFFDGCFSLTTIDLSSFDTHNVTKMIEMFKGCSSLTFINLFSFNAIKANIKAMFTGCANLYSCVSFDKNIVNEFITSKML